MFIEKCPETRTLEILLSFNLSRLLLKGLECLYVRSIRKRLQQPFIMINFFSIFQS